MVEVADFLIPAASALGMAIGGFYTYQLSQISIDAKNEPLLANYAEMGSNSEKVTQKLKEISSAIQEGATSFLFAEYRIVAVFMVLFAIVLATPLLPHNAFVAPAFIFGGLTSLLCGFIGMKIAVYANVRTAKEAQKSVGAAFIVAVKAGAVMGFVLVSLGLFNLYILMRIYRAIFPHTEITLADGTKVDMTLTDMFETVAGYGLGGSAIALFGRVGGGIYTKAADVGADLVGKVEQGIPEDDPRNPAVIADNVGDNVGDIAGMGADLFGSLAESTCAALVVSSYSKAILHEWDFMCFPLYISAAGIVCCFVTQFFGTACCIVQRIEDIEKALKRLLLISTILMTPAIILVAALALPSGEFALNDLMLQASEAPFRMTRWDAVACLLSGLWAGLVIGYITEYFTSHSYTPVRDVSASCQTGAATNIIYGLALGYKSCIIPVLAIAVVIFVSFKLAGMYGIALGALGMLSTLCIGLTIDAYGPISDNAGGIAEMAGLGEDIRKRTDALDAAGNTTAAIGKGFAIGSAALVSLSLFGAFVTRSRLSSVNIVSPMAFAGLLVGAMMPYAFSAMTMKSVGKAALSMVQEVRRQFQTIPGLMAGTGKPDYAQCVKISTDASLREMLLPGAQVILTPLVVGFIFGPTALAGLLAGSLVSGVQMAISSSNTGGAWDNAKKYIEAGNFGGKHSAPHAAAVIGDTVGDPLKDTSGPSLNILIKLMAILSLVFAETVLTISGKIWGENAQPI